MPDMQLTFGKYEGAYVSQVPSYYLWYLIQNAYEPTIRQCAHDEWIHRNRMNNHWLMPKKKRFS